MKTRIIPILLINNRRLVKTIQFENEQYIGDPQNSVAIFSKFPVDELVILDITKKQNNPEFELIEKISTRSNLPLSYGGKIRSLEDVDKIISSGYEKVIVRSAIQENPKLINEISTKYGSQALCISIDYHQEGENIFHRNSTNILEIKYTQFKKNIMQYIEQGAGEILLNNYKKDGTYSGLDKEFAESLQELISVPLVAVGGTASEKELIQCVSEGKLSGIGVGSLFNFSQQNKGVLIHIPTSLENLLAKRR